MALVAIIVFSISLDMLKDPSSIRNFARLILNSFYEILNLPSIHCNMLAHLCNFFYVVFVKSSDKLLNFLVFGQTLCEVKIETLKTHKFHPL